MTGPQPAEAVRAGDRAHGPAGDELAAARASRCYAADTCAMDRRCPFAAACARIGAEWHGHHHAAVRVWKTCGMWRR